MARTDYSSGDVSPLALAMDAIMTPKVSFRSMGALKKGIRAALLRRKYLKLHGRAYESLLDSYLAATEDTASTSAKTVIERGYVRPAILDKL